MSRLLRMIIAALVSMLAFVAACSPPPEDETAPTPTLSSRWPATEFYEVPDSIRDATIVWSAEPGIDLFSAEAKLFRAAQESVFIGWMIGLDYTYVGFKDSSGSKGGGGIFGDFEDDTGEGPFVGTIHGRIQQIIPTDTGFDVLGCVLSVGLDVRTNDKYSPSRLTDGEGGDLRSRFIRTVDPKSVLETPPTSSVRKPSSLHWQAPTGDQFTGWEVEGFVDIDPATAEKGRCVPWAKSLYPDAPAVIPRDAYANDEPPPVLPAFPGWPEDRY